MLIILFDNALKLAIDQCQIYVQLWRRLVPRADKCLLLSSHNMQILWRKFQQVNITGQCQQREMSDRHSFTSNLSLKWFSNLQALESSLPIWSINQLASWGKEKKLKSICLVGQYISVAPTKILHVLAPIGGPQCSCLIHVNYIIY